MAWQYQHYHPQTYSSIYSQAQEQYAGQTYQQAWYNYYQQQARAVAAAQQAGTATTSTATTVPAPTGSTTVTPVATVAPIPTAPATSTTFSTFNPTFVLPKLMYGFGDDKQVAADTVAVMEEILIEYIVDVCQTALSPTKKNRLQIEDLRRALSRPADAKKLARMEELLFMQEDIKRARKQFEENEMGGGTGDY
ncbi:hypothetical protein A7U60_g6188 [Sanghuangporus baumii]|uniref:Transcription initiation factor TFIID subunit 13 n=1 Tax=Sanghuangporus baumii TaxID=108892 RepID=A0A9Q5HVP1_SANBA|nr:hypothetical protein A7U60_g6188 [Sanghuangporus baumii]